ncbi:hypothetical protein [uncultured Campylobacter sp.]|uniref:hypothetical protein n=1 Tax=uncultured Campylobacter sp. TaxID=218934 RepID=UPI00260D282D|nr:hypothetical protein [uncultured Campylobacter sp.]
MLRYGRQKPRAVKFEREMGSNFILGAIAEINLACREYGDKISSALQKQRQRGQMDGKISAYDAHGDQRKARMKRRIFSELGGFVIKGPRAARALSGRARACRR